MVQYKIETSISKWVPLVRRSSYTSIIPLSYIAVIYLYHKPLSYTTIMRHHMMQRIDLVTLEIWGTTLTVRN